MNLEQIKAKCKDCPFPNECETCSFYKEYSDARFGGSKHAQGSDEDFNFQRNLNNWDDSYSKEVWNKYYK